MKKQEKNITWKVADIISKIYFAMILKNTPFLWEKVYFFIAKAGEI